MSIKVLSKEASERNELRELAKALNEEARENFGDAGWRRDRAVELTETISEGFDHENVISLMSDVEYIGWEDQTVVSEVSGLKAFFVARGGYIEESELKENKFAIPREIAGFHVTALQDKLEANFAGTTRAMIDLGVQRLDATINRWFMTMVQNAVGSGHPNYVSASSLSLNSVNQVLARVRDASRSRDVAIVGRSTMTDQFVYQILGTNNNGSGYLPQTNEDLIRRGVLGSYMGANIVTLNNYADENNRAFVPANELYVVAKDASRTFFPGGMRTNEWLEQANDYWHFRARKEVASAVIHSDRLGRIIDTSVAP